MSVPIDGDSLMTSKSELVTSHLHIHIVKVMAAAPQPPLAQ